MTGRLNVAIVGAGIGGLSAALALNARALNVTVFEGAESPREAGAGLSIPPNALTLLKRTSLCEAIEQITTRSQGLTLRTSQGQPVSRPGAPMALSYQIHRVELLELLLGAVKGPVRFGHRCIAVADTERGARLTFANGVVCDADVVIGADGIHSVVQRQIGLVARPTSEGVVAYRGLVPAEELASGLELRGLNMWMGDGRSFICFPVSQGRLINIVAFVPSMRDMEETWFAPGDVRALAGEYEGWDAPVQDLIAALDHTFRWGIYDRPPLPYWSRGHVTLLGDAVHPMVPHFGQGAGQAIEDGFVLAVLLEHAGRDEIPARLKAYQDLRLERTSRVQAASRLAGRFYRSAGGDPAEQAQRMRGWMSAAEWIFSYDAEEAALAVIRGTASAACALQPGAS
ncbi:MULTISPECIES: FAD-dependent monooxygenase [Bradyrhizobium]|uniref:FAD-dependent monooxygenase n=1 Tax=Bradyrhizobium TaxID=374 RepID=UPI00040E7472|nr:MULTISPECIES: FAD-dependent monooxygenase [Bradyrhizobium]QOG23109.1 FAD-binding protein [Bradyrhizobium sp. SEMIA]UFW53487.1 FAD-dependent monooxygenase [Bradyrhizobium arachidis]